MSDTKRREKRTWRSIARDVVAEVLLRTFGQAEALITEELRKAYPFGPRRHHPYKVWLDEVQRQRFQRRRGKLGVCKPVSNYQPTLFPQQEI